MDIPCEAFDSPQGKFTIQGDIMLGQGASSQVHLATAKSSGVQYAVKIITKLRLTERGRSNLARELSIHARLSELESTTICNMCSVEDNNYHYFVFLEYLPGGDLVSYIEKKGRLPEEEAAYIFRKVSESIAFIHSNGIVHRDIKAENFLLSFNEDGDVDMVKLTDFGLAASLTDEKVFSTPCGSPCYTGMFHILVYV